jgi:hypothetical protein
LWDFQPKTVEHISLTATDAIALKNAPVSNVVVTTSTLGAAPEAAYVEGVDYTEDLANGTITRINGGAITAAQVVKVTYDANPQIILTHMNNFIVGIGRDVRIEKDRDIFKGVNQYAITAKWAVEYEEDDAIVKVRNVGTGV